MAEIMSENLIATGGFLISFVLAWYPLNKCEYCWSFFTQERYYFGARLEDRTGGLTLCGKHNRKKPWLK